MKCDHKFQRLPQSVYHWCKCCGTVKDELTGSLKCPDGVTTAGKPADIKHDTMMDYIYGGHQPNANKTTAESMMEYMGH